MPRGTPRYVFTGLLLAVFVTAAPTLAAGQKERPARQILKIVRGRNLSAYDFGGFQGCGGYPLPSGAERCESSTGKARDFIWRHWQEKRRGYVVVALSSVDARSDAHIFIEPDAEGIWRVAWWWERIYGVDGMKGEIEKVPGILSVARKIASGGDPEFRAGTPYLSFIGKGGKEVARL